MVANAECAFAKENGRAVFTVLDDERLRSHGQNFLAGAEQVEFSRKTLGFGVVDQEHVDTLECFDQVGTRTVDPVVHGVAAGEANSVHLAANRSLQSGMNIAQEQEL